MSERTRMPVLDSPFIIAAAFVVGVVAGLRSMTAPAAVALARHAPVLGLLFVIAAIVEDVVDKHPKMPSRLRFPSIALRPISGALSAYFLAGGIEAGAIGFVGAVAGSFAGAAWRGYWAKRGSTDLLPALLEDAAAALLAWGIVFAFT